MILFKRIQEKLENRIAKTEMDEGGTERGTKEEKKREAGHRERPLAPSTGAKYPTMVHLTHTH